MAPLLTDSQGHTVEVEEKKTSAKQLVFDYSGLVAIGLAFAAWGVMSNRTDTNAQEIERLRAANDTRASEDLKNAQNMATKSDIRDLSAQLQALAAELRARAAK